MKRREFTNLAALLGTGSMLTPLLSKAAENHLTSFFENDNGLPKNLPSNIRALVENVLKQKFSDVNTDWFGSIQIEGLLRFANRGFKQGYEFADKWFKYHIENDGKLTDEEYFKQYDGPKARILRDGPLAFVIYSANLGVSFPVHELYKINKDATAKRVCFDVADAVLHYAGRDRFGMLAHDDYNYMNFAIPDTAYWATRTNAIAATLCTDKDVAAIYWKQAIFQLEAGIKYFLDKEKKLVRTGLFKGENATTYWCRSQGWLLWAIAGLLRYLPPSHPKFKPIAENMKIIADGVKKYQSKSGGLHVLVDDPSTPEEVTSISMVLSALKEGTRKGWIPNEYDEVFAKAWAFILKSVDEKGNVHNAYTGWAVPAEQKQVNKIDERFMGFVPGIIIVAADEMIR
ncbi:glycoside hydrolase family 88 protein [Parasediminibacterium sp. JCM 36343]|uniref:glycoside hydrolase family 88 protein n=1 Tax=Parasediminibacterium sp. JCM 36343 TaxID=3374279 RepID=UPI00397B1EB0